MSANNNTLLFLKSSSMGEGEPDLGEKLIGSFLDMLIETGNIPARVVCVNTGIFLTTEGSAMTDTLRKLVDAGSEILSCGTCLDYYDRRDKLVVGEPTNMKVIVESLIEYKKVLTP